MRKLNFQSYVLKLNRQNRRNKKVRFSWHLVPLISTSFSQLIAADVRYLRPKHNRHKNNIYFRTIGSSNGIARTWKRRYLFAVYNTFWTRWIINKMLNNLIFIYASPLLNLWRHLEMLNEIHTNLRQYNAKVTTL